MNKKIFIAFSFVALLALLIIACKKEDDTKSVGYSQEKGTGANPDNTSAGTGSTFGTTSTNLGSTSTTGSST